MKRPMDTAEYIAFVRRIVRAAGRRAGTDIESLPHLIALRSELDGQITEAVTAVRTDGYSWADIAKRTGGTRQAAQQRWG
ncbi:hypothetical protein [Rhodococcoides fascians]|uniref:hypothetical protein n=1 Tax=Rhodococcoides fascians TaxID=1828 RepID=UPI001C52AB69|nr:MULTISPECIES: hypothetical protein [Rhodococcus]